jgi:hypothetical protein
MIDLGNRGDRGRRSVPKLATLAVVGLARGLAGLLALAAGPVHAESTLAAVKVRGQLLCGINGQLPGFSVQNERNEWAGFEIDYCRASGHANDYTMLPDIVARDPLAPYVRTGDGEWLDVVRWTHLALLEAEELGITQANVDEQLRSPLPAVRRLLGVAPATGKMLGLEENWAYKAIKQVGNYGEIYEGNVGKGSALRFARGVNALWSRGGVMYLLPMR